MGPRLAVAVAVLALIGVIDWPGVSRTGSWRERWSFLMVWLIAAVGVILLALDYQPPGVMQGIVQLIRPAGEWLLGPLSP